MAREHAPCILHLKCPGGRYCFGTRKRSGSLFATAEIRMFGGGQKDTMDSHPRSDTEQGKKTGTGDNGRTHLSPPREDSTAFPQKNIGPVEVRVSTTPPGVSGFVEALVRS